ncbi:DUF1310 family protein [Streptococcus oricebi]|uniref:DUF1310 family protein n=1 Tax=Streptococcus oricebi TaxID=1547447 RepID=A0ABS5B183_9STRE|nr:DUF1310 family protein [Streptococcus oricebi]MBP2622431.1 hypothetical protein [Streptococcus oricebi]
MKKILLVIGIVCSIFLLVLGGCSMQGKSKKETEKEKMIKIVESEEAKALLDEWMKNMDPKALTPEGKIKTYKVSKNKLKYNPMGGMMVPIVINDNPKLHITVHIFQDPETGKLDGSGSTSSPELGQLLRGE